MTPQQYCDLLLYIEENNGWGANMYKTIEKHRVAVKYVDACFDSRDGRVWRISLRNGGSEGRTFQINSEEDIKRIYAFLNKERSH